LRRRLGGLQSRSERGDEGNSSLSVQPSHLLAAADNNNNNNELSVFLKL